MLLPDVLCPGLVHCCNFFQQGLDNWVAAFRRAAVTTKDLLLGLLVHFPIKGRRLQQLEREQARSFRAVQRRSTSTISVASKLRLCLFLNSVLK